jgi:hypothetical protein
MFESESVFVDPVSVEVAFGLFPMTATNAVQCLIVGVVEGAVSGVDFGLAVGLGAPGRIPGGDPLGIGFESASHSCCSFGVCPLPLLRQGVLRFGFDCYGTFSAPPSRPNQEGRRVDAATREAERCTA